MEEASLNVPKPKMPSQLRRLHGTLLPPASAVIQTNSGMGDDGSGDDDTVIPPAAKQEPHTENLSATNAVAIAKAVQLLKQVPGTEAQQKYLTDRISGDADTANPADPRTLAVAFQQSLRYNTQCEKRLEALRGKQSELEDQISQLNQELSQAAEEAQHAADLHAAAYKAVAPTEPASPVIGALQKAFGTLETVLKEARISQKDADAMYAKLMAGLRGAAEAPVAAQAPAAVGALQNEAPAHEELPPPDAQLPPKKEQRDRERNPRRS